MRPLPDLFAVPTQVESVQLCQLVVQQGRHDLIEKWLNADQLEYILFFGRAPRGVPLSISLALACSLTRPSRSQGGR